MARPPHPSLVRAKQRLDKLALYPRPVRLAGVQLRAAPWFFQLPWLRRFDGYATHLLILVRKPEHLADEDLVTHELCHVWQMQHHPLGMPLSYLRGYSENRYELEARSAVARTRA